LAGAIPPSSCGRHERFLLYDDKLHDCMNDWENYTGNNMGPTAQTGGGVE